MSDQLLPVLDDCLARLEAGASVADCLALYPEQADDLAPLLRAAARLRAIETPAPRAAFLADSPARLVRRIQAGETARPAAPTSPSSANGAAKSYPSPGSNGHPQPAPPLEVVPPLTNGHRPLLPQPALRRRPQMAWLAVAAALLVTLLGIGTIRAAADSLPGDALYSVKRAGEAVWLALPRSPLQQVEARLALAQTRLDEVYRLSQHGDEARAALALADYQAALLEAEQQAEATDPAQALSGAFGVDAERLRAAHAQGVAWRELTLALSLTARAGGPAGPVIERLLAGEPTETVLASLSQPPVITAALPALLGDTPVSPTLAPPTQTPVPSGTAPTATPALANGTPLPRGFVAPLPSPTGPTAARPSGTPGRELPASPAPPTSTPPGEIATPSGDRPQTGPTTTAPTSPPASSVPSTPATAPGVTPPSGADKDVTPDPANRLPLEAPTLSPGGPSLPTVAPILPTAVPGLPPVAPSEVPTLPPALPTALPTLPPIASTALPTLPPIVSTALPTLPPIVPTALPTLPPVIPTAVPTLPPIISTALPTLPPVIPTALPTVPPVIPTAVPTLPPIVPTALPTLPPIAPTEVPTLPPVLPTTLPVLPTTAPLPTTPPILPTIRRP